MLIDGIGIAAGPAWIVGGRDIFSFKSCWQRSIGRLMVSTRICQDPCCCSGSRGCKDVERLGEMRDQSGSMPGDGRSKRKSVSGFIMSFLVFDLFRATGTVAHDRERDAKSCKFCVHLPRGLRLLRIVVSSDVKTMVFRATSCQQFHLHRGVCLSSVCRNKGLRLRRSSCASSFKFNHSNTLSHSREHRVLRSTSCSWR